MRIICLLLTICLLSSCDDQRLYENNKELADKYWLADSVLNFEFEVQDIGTPYNLYINIRNTASYPYENIYLTYYLKDSLDKELKSELINYNLFDPKTGQPFGEGLGDIFDHQFLLLKNYQFQTTGTYSFNLQQYMRMDSLPEVLAAGVRVERVSVDNGSK